LILDEPTSSLTERESEKLFEIITLLKYRGVGIIAAATGQTLGSAAATA